MPNFVVTKKEQYTQEVLVKDVQTPEEAIDKALNGDCTIHDDAQYDCDIASSTWETRRVE